MSTLLLLLRPPVRVMLRRKSRWLLLALSTAALALVLLAARRGGAASARAGEKRYAPDWDSLDSRPLPGWFDRAKVGIFMHFGPYSVPGVGSEWFWFTATRHNDSDCARYLRKHLPPNFAYPDFGPQLSMEFFDADLLSDIVADSGAKYFVFTSKHHDGFCNWGSAHTYNWNSVSMGPKRDVLAEIRSAFSRRHGDKVRFGLYYSLYEWFNPLYLRDKENQFATKDYVENKMLPELKDLVTEFRPEVLWSDGDWEAPPEYFDSKEFLAWLYNESPSRGSVVTNDRWGQGTRLKHGDFFSGPDRYEPGVLLGHKWENAMTVDRRSWGIRRNLPLEDVMEAEELIGKLVATVSCGGNILVNVGPTKEGVIIPIFRERLRQMGQWLRANGEAIYGTRPWTVQNDTTNDKVWYTAKGDSVYAISLEWPEEDILKISPPGLSPGRTKAFMLGLASSSSSSLPLRVVGQEAHVEFPKMSRLARECGKGCSWAYVVKLENLVPVVQDTKP